MLRQFVSYCILLALLVSVEHGEAGADLGLSEFVAHDMDLFVDGDGEYGTPSPALLQHKLALRCHAENPYMPTGQ